jgi:hypothetical protein
MHAVAKPVVALRYKPEGCEIRFGIRQLNIFNLPNPSSCALALGFIQPLTKLGTGRFSVAKGRPGRKAYNLTAICQPNV